MFRPASPAAVSFLLVLLAVASSAPAQESRNLAEVETAQTFFPGSAANDTERRASAAIAQVRAVNAQDSGISGKGVTIAILDSGISAGHSEFAEAGKLLPGYNAVTGGTNVSDVNDARGHGTHVAGLLGAVRDGRGISGIAYDARILPIKVLADDGKGTTRELDRGLRYAIGRAQIVNMSLGSPTASNPGAMQEAVRAGLLLVAAAGNSGAANPEWPARYAKESWANNQIIAVGAVDAQNRIASFSNRAGDTAAWFLVAPGVAQLSSIPGQQYSMMSGTSMATPIVSGAAALIKQMWPYLRADQVGSILLITATDLGAPGIDPVYGRGLLNVERALQPVGNIKTTTWSGKAVRIIDTSLVPSPATGRLWALAASGALDAVGMDDFNRGFPLRMGASVARPATLSLNQVFDSLERRTQIAELVLADGARFTVAEQRLTHAFEEAHALRAFSYVSAPGQKNEFAFGSGGMAARYFGIAGLPQFADAGITALANPYFSLAPDAMHMAAGTKIGNGMLRFGWLSAGQSPHPAAWEMPFRDPVAPAGPVKQLRADMAIIEMMNRFSSGVFTLSFARTQEGDAFLGAQSAGTLAFGTHAATTSLQAGAVWLISPGLALAGQAAFGATPGSVDPFSLIRAVSPIYTNAFSLALVASNRLRAGDRFSFSIAQPLRAWAGSITLDSVVGLDPQGREVRVRRELSMVPAARELMAELNYQAPLGPQRSLGVVMSLRSRPNHLADAAPEKLFAVRLAQGF